MAYPAMQQLINRMTRKGFSRNYLLQIFSGVERDNNILAKVKSPAETKPWRSYRPIFLTEQRIQGGVGFWRRYEGALNAATQRFGVDPEYIVAIIGVETLYGRNTGKYNVLRSLTTLAMDFPKRSKFYTSELEQFLQLTREEKINNPAALKGSYAGAMGMGQFISSSYRNFAVDFNGDRHRDLWHPVDAIGSVANYFSRHGWKRGGDVAVPARITGTSYARIAHTEAKKPIYSLRQLAQYGVTPAQPIRSTRVDLLRLIGTRSDEYWVTGDNFYTITRYNHSPKYAMAVYQLAQEIKRRKTGR
jgi:membrane-bound lytic murein transglycosylase B